MADCAKKKHVQSQRTRGGGSPNRAGTGEKKAFKFEIVEGREMTELEAETVASILFNWWRRELESGEPMGEET